MIRITIDTDSKSVADDVLTHFDETTLTPRPMVTVDWHHDDGEEAEGYAIHIGIHHANVDEALDRLRYHSTIAKAVHYDGDGWEAWGEAPDVDENIRQTSARHIVVVTDFLELGLDLVKNVVGDMLLPMRTPRQKGFVVSVTRVHDWSDELDRFTSL